MLTVFLLLGFPVFSDQEAKVPAGERTVVRKVSSKAFTRSSLGAVCASSGCKSFKA